MAFYVYILRCSDGLYYTGQTDDLERRLAEHKRGEYDGFTAGRLPVELMWCEMFPTRMEARDAEYRIKPWSRAKKETLFRSDWAALKRASVPPKERATRS
jgi:predicted GIY-YIG superfamily endonuclease